MGHITILKTDAGNIPIVINEVSTSYGMMYYGQFFNSEGTQQIVTTDRERCVMQLKIAYEIKMNNWLKEQLLEIGV